MSKTSPLAKRRSLRIKDLANETLLLPNRMDLYEQAGISPNVLHVALTPWPNSDSEILLVACQKGIFIMPDEASSRPHPGGEVVCVPLEEPDAKIAVCVAWRKNEKSSTVPAFLESVRRVFRCPPEYPVTVEARTPSSVKLGREVH